MQIIKEFGPVNTKPAKNSHPLDVVAEKYEIEEDEGDSIEDPSVEEAAVEDQPVEDQVLEEAKIKAFTEEEKQNTVRVNLIGEMNHIEDPEKMKQT